MQLLDREGRLEAGALGDSLRRGRARAVRVREQPRPPADCRLERFDRLAQVALDLLLRRAAQVEVRRAVALHPEARPLGLEQLVGREDPERAVRRLVPLVRPAEERRGDEDRRWEAVPSEDRRGVLEHAPVAVVEGDRDHRPPAAALVAGHERRQVHDLGRPGEERHLRLEGRAGDEQAGAILHALADRVVGEDGAHGSPSGAANAIASPPRRRSRRTASG